MSRVDKRTFQLPEWTIWPLLGASIGAACAESALVDADRTAFAVFVCLIWLTMLGFALRRMPPSGLLRRVAWVAVFVSLVPVALRSCREVEPSWLQGLVAGFVAVIFEILARGLFLLPRESDLAGVAEAR
jgi:hypothetical protein